MAARLDAGVQGAAARGVAPGDYCGGALHTYLDRDDLLVVGAGEIAVADGSQATIFAGRRLQRIADYRGALQRWFRALRIGGHLVIAVPHAFLHGRQMMLPARLDPAQRRLYTPRSLLDEVEEALAPNSYRIRYLGDDDDGYDYAAPADGEPAGHSDVLLVLERIAQPDWPLLNVAQAKATAPDYAWEPALTRIEAPLRPASQKILIMKLDHLGDFIMAIPALRKARAAFADAEITLVVGSWNLDVARRLGVADHVLGFDAFPRNSSEEEVDVHAKADLFGALLPDHYDLAIDLRTDVDTRQLLKKLGATLKAGIGTKAQFPFLDIFLPLDWNRNEPETAREDVIGHQSFASQGSARRSDNRIVSEAGGVEREYAIVWGPYWRLRPGNYVFEPHFEAADGVGREGGALRLDVALDAVRVVDIVVSGTERPRLPFRVGPEGASFEFRIWVVDGRHSLDLSFFGGRLLRQGASSVLHQSEYSSLMIELVRMRTRRFGMLEDVRGWS